MSENCGEGYFGPSRKAPAKCVNCAGPSSDRYRTRCEWCGSSFAEPVDEGRVRYERNLYGSGAAARQWEAQLQEQRATRAFSLLAMLQRTFW